MTRIRVPVSLRLRTGGSAQLELACATVAECLLEMERRFPGVAGELRDDAGQLLSSVSLFVNGEDVRHRSGLATPLAGDDELAIVIPIAGGQACGGLPEAGHRRHRVRALLCAGILLVSLLSPSMTHAHDSIRGEEVQLDQFRSPGEIYDFIAGLTEEHPAKAIDALDAMLSQPDRHKRKTSLKEFMAVYPRVAARLLREMDAGAMAKLFLRDTMNSSPPEALATLMVNVPDEAARIVGPISARLVDRRDDDRYRFLEAVQEAMILVVNHTEDVEAVVAVYREFAGELGAETFARFIESGWSEVKYGVGHPDRRVMLQEALVRLGLPPRSYDPTLLDDDLLDGSILAEAGRTKLPLGQQSPWALYLYSAGDNDLEWWEGYRQLLNLERIGSDPRSLQMVALVDPYSSAGEIRDRVTLAMGRKVSRPFGATDATRVYYIEESPYAVVDREGRVYALDPGRKVWAETPRGERVETTIPEVIESRYTVSPGGYPIIDREGLTILEWDTLVEQYPELQDRDVMQVIGSPVLEVGERDTGDLESLVGFWELAREKAPANRTLLVVAGHGAGVSGIGWDYATGVSSRLEIDGLARALAGMTEDGRRPIDVLFLQGCSMQDFEVARKVAPYVRWLVGFEPTSLTAQNAHELVALAIKDDPGITPERVARTIVSARDLPDDVMASAVDSASMLELDEAISGFAVLMQDGLKVDAIGREVVDARLKAPTEGDPDRVDLVAFMEFLHREMEDIPDAGQPEELVELKRRIRVATLEVARLARLAMPQIKVDPQLRQGLNGMSIWFPLEGAEWRGTGWTSGWEYFTDLANPAWAEFVEASTPFLSPVMRYDGGGRLLQGNPSIWRFVDEVSLRPVVDGLVSLGEKDEGVYELAVPASAVHGYSGAQGGGIERIDPDRDGRYRVWVKGFSWGSYRPNEIVPVRLVGSDGGRVFEQQRKYHTISVNE